MTYKHIHTLLNLPSDFTVAYAANISEHFNCWMRGRPLHRTTSPTLFDKCVGSLTSLDNLVTLKMQETGPTVYSPYPRRLQRLTSVFKGERLLIPKQMRPKMKERNMVTKNVHTARTSQRMLEKSQRVYVLARYDCRIEGVHLPM